MALSPALIERLVEIAGAAARAGHGGKEPIYTAAIAELGISRASLLRYLKEVTVKPLRKRRSDAGQVYLLRGEAVQISAYLMESLRKNKTKRLASIEKAVEVLRNEGIISAERLDESTGEIIPLSESAISRALRTYHLHPDQLLRPAPAVELKSLYPNHVWQIDASLCVLYYINTCNPREAGLQVMDADRFYKNKPKNLKRIENDRVWSYEVTDHNSGSIFVHYVLGAESAANLAETFIAAITQRSSDPFYGVPKILMMDMGSANTSGLFKNLARRLQVELIAHKPGNARATGQVENARNIIERDFESGLRFKPARDLDHLNALAQQWVRYYNGTKIHSRHGKTRWDQWMTIAEHQLRIAPPMEICRELLSANPKGRKVTDELTVEFKSREFCVRNIPGVMVGESLPVTYNPYDLDAAFVVDHDSEGNEVLHRIPVVERGTDGFRLDGNIIGQDYSRPPRTIADDNRDEVAQAAMGVGSMVEVEAARKKKQIPFGGRIDPFRIAAEVELPTFLPRRGTQMEVSTRTVVTASVLSLFEVATELARLGVPMDADKNRMVASWYPEGVPETELHTLQHRLTTRAGLRVVGE